jgi:hypothetical protein
VTDFRLRQHQVWQACLQYETESLGVIVWIPSSFMIIRKRGYPPREEVVTCSFVPLERASCVDNQMASVWDVAGRLETWWFPPCVCLFVVSHTQVQL